MVHRVAYRGDTLQCEQPSLRAVRHLDRDAGGDQLVKDADRVLDHDLEYVGQGGG